MNKESCFEPFGGGSPSETDAKDLLLVDDDDIFRERLAKALRERGLRVRTAAGYEQAMESARTAPPELAVVDLRLVGPSGLELTRDLHALCPQTRILVLTGYGSIATAIEAMRLGAAYYVSKPADADDVLAAFARSAAPPLEPGPDYVAPSLARAEWEHINRVLVDCGGNISEAARRLGMHRRSLQRKLRKYPPRQ